MSDNIYITGLGIISAIGNNVDESVRSFRNKKTGIGSIKYLNTVHKDKFLAGEVKLSNDELLSNLGIDRTLYCEHTRTSLLGIMAAKQAATQAGLTYEELKNVALVSATTVGGMDKTELCYQNEDYQSTDYVRTHHCGDSTDKIANYLNIKSYRSTLSTACSSGANAIVHGIRLINNGLADIVIAGGVDALSKFTLNGFNSLMIFDEGLCKPFDKNRKGLNLGEGAGFVVLESESSLKKRKAKALCLVSGYANANDAYHQTASSPEGVGATLAMQKALDKAGLEPQDVSYINVHGTGTENNDLSEGVAIKNIFKDKLPPFSSTKGFTGHTLAASAGIEAVFSALSIINGAIFPNLHFTEPIDDLNMIPETDYSTGHEIKHVLSNSFGFGGNNSTLIFSAV